MCYSDHIIIVTLQLGPWQPPRPLRPYECETEYHARLRSQKQDHDTTVSSALSGWRMIINWLQHRRVKRQPPGPG